MDKDLKNKIVSAANAVLAPATDCHGMHAFSSQEVKAIAEAIAKAIEAYEQNK